MVTRAEPAAVDAWKSLDSHLNVVGRIGLIASHFGPTGSFALMIENAQGDMHKIEDTAIWCCGGDLEADSAFFRRPGTHRASPWCRTLPRLNTVAEAKERYRAWREVSRDKTHYNRTVQHQKPDGSVGKFVLQNPFKAKAPHDREKHAAPAAPTAATGQAADRTIAAPTLTGAPDHSTPDRPSTLRVRLNRPGNPGGS